MDACKEKSGIYNCEHNELSNPGSILMCVRMYSMYVSVTLRNVTVTSRRNVASMMRIRRASNYSNA